MKQILYLKKYKIYILLQIKELTEIYGEPTIFLFGKEEDRVSLYQKLEGFNKELFYLGPNIGNLCKDDLVFVYIFYIQGDYINQNYVETTYKYIRDSKYSNVLIIGSANIYGKDTLELAKNYFVEHGLNNSIIGTVYVDNTTDIEADYVSLEILKFFNSIYIICR